jgi:molybdenum cofactor biosynthesis enzyme MoaA
MGLVEFEGKHAIKADLLARSPIVSSLPYYYQIHLNKFCNQKCIMCLPSGKHPRDEMPFDKFVAFFDQIKPYAERLTLIGGETLLYRWIDEVLDLLSQHPIAVTIVTNATALTEKMSRRLLSLHQLDLRCSVDAANRSSYLKVHGTDVFDRVISQIRRFSEMARAQENVRLIMHYVVMRENLGDVLPFVELAKPLHPYRVEFHPVAHVFEWDVDNGTNWEFRGWEQSCQSFKAEYNETMSQANAKCEAEGVPYEVLLL